MSGQADAANEFVRSKLGAEADVLAEASGFKPAVLPGGKDVGGDEFRDTRPWLLLPGMGRTLSDFARDLGRTLASGGDVFRRLNVIVTVNADTGELERVTAERLRTLAEQHVVTFKSFASRKGSEDIACSMTKECASGVLQADKFVQALRPIDRVNQVRRPVWRADGRVELLPVGYDEESRVFTLESSVKIDEAMTLEAARKVLGSYIDSFPFKDERSKAVHVAMMLAMFGDGLLSALAPRLSAIWRSNGVGSGKSLLAQMTGIPSWGVLEPTPWENEEELRKSLDAAALQNVPVVFFDNLEGHVKSKLVDAFVTAPKWGGRVMGTQQRFKAEKTTVLLITGNNLTVSQDIERRALLCNLEIKEFDLRDRRHERELDPETLSSAPVRSEILSALWACVRHWDAAGRPGAGSDPKRPMVLASFEKWSRVFGGITQAAGYGNPLAAPTEETSASSESRDLKRLVTLMADGIVSGRGRVEMRFEEIVEMCWENELLPWMMTKGKVLKSGGDDGSEGSDSYQCTAAEQSAIGLMLTKKLCGKTLRLADDRVVRFDKQGSHRQRRYFVELVK